MAQLFYHGHGSWRLTSSDGKVFYIDPCCGSGYDIAADAIFVTHEHFDHNAVDIMPHNPDCIILRPADFHPSSVEYKTFAVCDTVVSAVQAGFNKNHHVSECVGLVIKIDGKKIYFSGDTSTTDDMRSGKLADMKPDYAILPCDGVFNMDVAEASSCAKLIAAKHSIPNHMLPMHEGKTQQNLFSEEIAQRFEAVGKLVLHPQESIEL